VGVQREAAGKADGCHRWTGAAHTCDMRRVTAGSMQDTRNDKNTNVRSIACCYLCREVH
jgi:hypothetical protein